jgi:2-oxoglutarate dehydrogenase E2 component (dihydrolipoamide succinyltransferase)
MKQDIVIPALGESISEATIGSLLKETGAQVAADEEIIELETDKVNQVLHAPVAGKLTLTVKTGDKVSIGQSIGFVESDQAADKEPQKDQPKKPAKDEPKIEQPKAETKKTTAAPEKSVSGSGRGTKEDFVAGLNKQQEVQPKQQSAPKETPTSVLSRPGDKKETRKKMSTVRKVIATRLVEVKQTTAMLTTFNEIDLSKILTLREKYKETFIKKYNAKLGFMSFFVKAVVEGLKVVPEVNSYIDGDDIVHREYYDIGIAVGTDRGLVVPVLRNCDHLTIPEIEIKIEEYARKAREGSLALEDLRGGSFTITNGGVYGSLLSTPILYPPQAGILGMHKVEKRPIVINDQIVIRPMMYVALSYDHRVIDGKEAVTFLVHVKNYLEDPARLLLEI